MAQTAAVILAAGHGTRMRSAIPKPLHEIAGRPMLRYVIDAVRGAGIEAVVVVVGHGAAAVERVLPPGVRAVRQAEQRGSADAARCAAEILADQPDQVDVVVAYGDCPLLPPALFAMLIDRRRATGATVALVASAVDEPTGYGRVLREADGRVRAVVEEKAATPDERTIREINAGVYCFDAGWLWGALPRVARSATGEYYLTDLVGMATGEGKLVQSISAPAAQTLGVNDRVQLAEAGAAIYDRVRKRLMRDGVTLIDPATTYVDVDVEIGRDTVLGPGTIIAGKTVVGEGGRIGPHSYVVDSTIGDRVQIIMSVVENSEMARGARIGPFGHLRSNARIGEEVQLGNFAEVKNACLGPGTKMHHFSYVGDADIGENVNVAAGTITCNYDAETGRKSRTVVQDGVALGSDTLLVAPVTIGRDAITGAGAVVTRDVGPEVVVVGVPARPVRQRRRGSR